MVFGSYEHEKLFLKLHHKQAIRAGLIIKSCKSQEGYEPFFNRSEDSALTLRRFIEKEEDKTVDSKVSQGKVIHTSETAVHQSLIKMKDIYDIMDFKNYKSNEENLEYPTLNRVLRNSGLLVSEFSIGSEAVQRKGIIEDVGESQNLLTEVMHAKLSVSTPNVKNIQFISNRSHEFKLKWKNGVTESLVMAVDPENEMAFLSIKKQNFANPKTIFVDECILIFNYSYRINCLIIPRKTPISIDELNIQSAPITKADIDTITADIVKKVRHTQFGVPFQADQMNPTQYFLNFFFVSNRYYISRDIHNGNKIADTEFKADDYMPYVKALLLDIRKIHYIFACLRAVAHALIREHVGYSTKPVISTEQIYNYIDHLMEYGTQKINAKSADSLHSMSLQFEGNRLIVLSEIVGFLFHKLIDTNIDSENDASKKRNILPDTISQLKNLTVEGTGLGKTDLREDLATLKYFGHLLAVYFYFASDFELKKHQNLNITDTHDTLQAVSSGFKWTVHLTMDVKNLCFPNLKSVMQPKDHFWMKKYNLFNEYTFINRSPKHNMHHWISVRSNYQQRYKFVVHRPHAHLVGAKPV